MSGDIDFEGGGSAPAPCVACGNPIVGQYWEANGKIACPSCKSTIDTVGSAGTPMSRFLMASALGTGAMALGTLAWWAVARYTGFQAALVAIGIGWLVGTAVQRGANGRGGWIYQSLAVGLTYLSVTFAVMFLAWGEIGAAQREEWGVLTWPMLFVIAFISPVLNGWGSILSVLIVGFGLYQAWQKNRRMVIAWTGPYSLREPGEAAPAASSLPPLPPPPGA